jgi:hypothetical protein
MHHACIDTVDCAGRVNNPGACQMPILSAEALEQVVIKAVFAAFRRALTLLVKKAVVSEGNTRSTFFCNYPSRGIRLQSQILAWS